jgi:sec-independent protein translocase protein TatA
MEVFAMPNLGAPELIIILVIILLLFGVGRIGKIGNELGSGIRSFREGLHGDDEPAPATPAQKADAASTPPVVDKAEPTTITATMATATEATPQKQTEPALASTSAQDAPTTPPDDQPKSQA